VLSGKTRTLTQKTKKTADRLNLPVEAVRLDKENTEAEIKSEDAMEAVRRSPVLRKFLTDPVNARTSHDDVENLSLIERIMQGTGRGVDIGQGLFYGAAEFAGEVTGIESLEEFGTEGRIENIQEAAEYGQRSQFTDIAGVGDTGRWIVDTASEQLPLMAPALAGSFAGAKLGLLAGPYAPIAVPVLAGLGAFIPSFIMGIGETQSALKEKDPDAEAHGAVLAAGTLIGSLDSLLPGKVGTKLMKGLGYDIAGEVSEEAVKKTLTEIAKKVTIATAKGSGLEGITESVQEAISEVAASAGVGEKVNVGELAHVMIEAFASGMLMGGGVTAVTNTYSDLVGRSKFDEEKLEALSNASKLSLLKERNPEKFNQVIKEMGEEYGTDTVYLDPEGAHTLFQSITLTEEGKTNETIQKILNEIPEAMEAGRNIEIPLGDWMVDVVESEIMEGIKPHTKLNPGLLSPNEASSIDIEAEKTRMLEAVTQKEIDEADVNESMVKHLMNIGQPRSQAEVNAFLWTREWMVIAEDTGEPLIPLVSQKQ